MFKGKRGRDNHILFKNCKPKYQNVPHKPDISENPIIEPELISLKDEIVHTEPHPLSSTYYGRPYTGNYELPGGNRHLRCGIPLPRISKYSKAAI